MNRVLGRVLEFQKMVHAGQIDLYRTLATTGQSPKTLMISCSDSRVVPEHIMQAAPGDLFVCRNAGNIVPPYSNHNGGVVSTVEYAVAVLGVTDIVVCGHSDCGAMKACANPDAVKTLPNVAAWLRHGQTAVEIVQRSYANLSDLDRVKAISLENIVSQLANLRTHPTVAAGIAHGEIALHGWFVDIHDGRILALDGEAGRFVALEEGKDLPVALKAQQRTAMEVLLEAAE